MGLFLTMYIVDIMYTHHSCIEHINIRESTDSLMLKYHSSYNLQHHYFFYDILTGLNNINTGCISTQVVSGDTISSNT